MGEFLTRAISVVAVVVCLNGYNTVLDKREQAEEQIRKQQAELEQSANAAKEGTITDGAYKDGTYTGEAQGFGGPVDVEVIVENGMISEINITSAEKEDGAYLSRACLKKAFRELRVPVCGRFYPNEGGVAGYGNRMRVKYTAKWGLQIAEMIFQTRSRAEDIIPTILEAQSAEVDTISGATFSSTGIKEAVAQALEEAANQED